MGPELPPQKANESEFSGKELPYEIVNGVPCYQEGHVIDGMVQIFERIGYNDRVGGTYLGIGGDGKELVVRVGPAEQAANIVRMEAAFLCKVEAANDWRYFSQVHKIFQTDDAFHMTLYFRGGPTLEQCFQFRNRRFTLGTAGRLASDVFDIIRCAHKHGYLVRDVDMNLFHFDAAWRHLFMADISSLVKDIAKGGGLCVSTPVADYVGSSDFAPLRSHLGNKVGARQDLESWFFLFIYMARGGLNWDWAPIDKVVELKEQMIKDGSLVELLPPQFEKIFKIIYNGDEISPVKESDYDEISKLVEEVYRDVGQVKDLEENLDFEREPTPDEIPRLVMCRDDEL
ncbi:unnamed protein product [Caenorhabditis bovis]|uniref:Protein kinase domain-containing protein n=1 Tax=Caenorhabditis bovis TaxID=2654633 RepID=A0A8S1EZZ6_9PELO|nr:unnamed protein product [Caenorhabditis bovis]